jgi:hypothetical protein
MVLSWPWFLSIFARVYSPSSANRGLEDRVQISGTFPDETHLWALPPSRFPNTSYPTQGWNQHWRLEAQGSKLALPVSVLQVHGFPARSWTPKSWTPLYPCLPGHCQASHSVVLLGVGFGLTPELTKWKQRWGVRGLPWYQEWGHVKCFGVLIPCCSWIS